MKSDRVKSALLAAIVFGALSVGAVTVGGQSRVNLRPGQAATIMMARRERYNGQKPYIVRIKRRPAVSVRSHHAAESRNGELYLAEFFLPVSLN
jgi:hypothetical protein